jgi:membrane protease YdiL (CAAX protease family)
MRYALAVVDPAPSLPPSDDLPPDAAHPPPFAARLVALIEVLICSDFLTQIALGGTLRALGESPRAVLFGSRRTFAEVGLGAALIFLALGIGVALLLSMRYLAPWLHTVPDNPLAALLRSPRDAWLFALVVLVAGGVREEIQRAFLLHRFSVWLGGPVVGIVVTSMAFGAGHLMQGIDAAVATGVLGAFWGIVYLRRRSAVAPMVSHAGFDLLQIAQFLVAGR